MVRICISIINVTQCDIWMDQVNDFLHKAHQICYGDYDSPGQEVDFLIIRLENLRDNDEAHKEECLKEMERLATNLFGVRVCSKL